jgi:hypothetical protein
LAPLVQNLFGEIAMSQKQAVLLLAGYAHFAHGDHRIASLLKRSSTASSMFVRYEAGLVGCNNMI